LSAFTLKALEIAITTSPEVRRLIHEVSFANPLWGAPRIREELLKFGIDVGQTCSKSMARHGRPPQGRRTFLLNGRTSLVTG
jgi:hypothetical protein